MKARKIDTHGQRECYKRGGCRCEPCRAAYTAYCRKYARPRKLIDGASAREHLAKLSKAGIGRRAVSDVTGLGVGTISAIRMLRTMKVQPATLQKILAVSIAAAADGAKIDAKPTRTLLRKLQRAGFTKAELARRINKSGRALRIGTGKRVRARTAMKVERFYNRVMAE